ncbi:MAG: response regulator [Candidatus Muiribacteriota bacterium]
MPNKTILIVDDNTENRMLIDIILKKANYNILEASNGSTALELLKKNNIDLILMDLQMPVMDGFEATEFIREYEKKNNKKNIIVALSAYCQEDDIKKAYESGCDYHIEKPIIKDDFLRDIQRLLNLHTQ